MAELAGRRLDFTQDCGSGPGPCWSFHGLASEKRREARGCGIGTSRGSWTGCGRTGQTAGVTRVLETGALLTEIPAPLTTAPPAAGRWQVWPRASGCPPAQAGVSPPSEVRTLRLRALARASSPSRGWVLGTQASCPVSHLSMYPSIWGRSLPDPPRSVTLDTRNTLFGVVFEVSRGSWAPPFLS